MSSSPLDELKSLNQARTSLMVCDTVDEVIQKALELVRHKLNCQVASIFLFTKNGVIKRRGINGIDQEGNSIENTWFSEEEYAPGASFSGKAIPECNPKQHAESGCGESQPQFGEPQWSNDLRQFAMDEQTKIPYLKKLEELTCGISVPLNGRYRTFGTLEVLNKLDNSKFSKNDVYWLTLIATNVANFISDFIRKKEVDAFTEITQKLLYLEVIDKDFHSKEQEVYDLVVGKITEDYTPYKACILRVANENGDLEFKAKSGTSDVDWLNMRSNVKKECKGIAVEVYQTKNNIFIENTDDNINKFYNPEFIKKNNFKSYVCIPLLIRGEVFGTISIFIGYYHEFSIDHKYFLNKIAFVIAAAVAKVRFIRDFQKVSQERDEAKDKIISAIRFARVDYFLQGALHDYKNDLLSCHQILQTVLDGTPVRKIENIINKKMQWIEERVSEIQKEFTPATSAPVDINQVVKEVVISFSQISGKNIQVSAEYESKIPMIAINESKIKDIVFNLVSNAVRAVQKANKKNSKISVKTGIVTSDRIEHIQIIVEDNGIGIGHEVKDKIFEKGFTTNNDDRGTGMGLFLAREVINNYGGKIYCESTVGKGTKFFIKIPLKRHLI